MWEEGVEKSQVIIFSQPKTVCSPQGAVQPGLPQASAGKDRSQNQLRLALISKDREMGKRRGCPQLLCNAISLVIVIITDTAYWLAKLKCDFSLFSL